MSNKIFFTADYHLGEDRLKIMQRDIYDGPQAMIDDLIAKHNAIVDKHDFVYVIGDAIYKKTPEQIENLDRFNGEKILIRGNHDQPLSKEQLQPFFIDVIPEGSGIDLEVAGIPCYLTHYPSCGKKDKFNLVGHIHAAWKFQLNMLNVGVDVNHFRPVSEDQVGFFYKAICEFYDRDVWIGYDEINQSHYETRGKKTSYFLKGDK